MAKKYDAIIIGTGQSGPALAGRLNEEVMKTAIVERKLVGGTCVNVGCTPSKTLVGSARVAYACREAHRFGVSIAGDVLVDIRQVRARKKKLARTCCLRLVAFPTPTIWGWIKPVSNMTSAA
jgi:pyruvate/2-oxoglutarate dehydrogenase complex dihydrolipoamide dehydrogenase (E3) component